MAPSFTVLPSAPSIPGPPQCPLAAAPTEPSGTSVASRKHPGAAGFPQHVFGGTTEGRGPDWLWACNISVHVRPNKSPCRLPRLRPVSMEAHVGPSEGVLVSCAPVLGDLCSEAHPVCPSCWEHPVYDEGWSLHRPTQAAVPAEQRPSCPTASNAQVLSTWGCQEQWPGLLAAHRLARECLHQHQCLRKFPSLAALQAPGLQAPVPESRCRGTVLSPHVSAVLWGAMVSTLDQGQSCPRCDWTSCREVVTPGGDII